MNTTFALVAILAVCLCAYGVLLAAFRLMTSARHRRARGPGRDFCLLLLVPLRTHIWRRLYQSTVIRDNRSRAVSFASGVASPFVLLPLFGIAALVFGIWVS